MLYTDHLRGPTQLDECFNFWYECFNFLPAFFHTLEIPPSLPKNPVHVTGSQRFWPLDVGLNTLTRNSAVLQSKFCPFADTHSVHFSSLVLSPSATERRQICGDFLFVFGSCSPKHNNVALAYFLLHSHSCIRHSHCCIWDLQCHCFSEACFADDSLN